MTKYRLCIPVFMISALITSGCSNNLYFAEGTHFGLQAQVAPSNPSPVEIDLGFRRYVVSYIPKNATDTVVISGPSLDQEQENDYITIRHDNDEIMSLRSSFYVNWTAGNPFVVEHSLATGKAAMLLSGNDDALQSLQVMEEEGNDE